MRTRAPNSRGAAAAASAALLLDVEEEGSDEGVGAVPEAPCAAEVPGCCDGPMSASSSVTATLG